MMLPSSYQDALKGNVFVLTGAGISAASGIRTFRGDEGLYRGLNPYDLASPEAFFRQPDVVWNWYLMRIREGWNCQPNPGHYALAELERRASSFTLITSNVDDLHGKAGSRNIYRLHGNVLETRCIGCGEVAVIVPDSYPDEVDDSTLPSCAACGSLLRPNVVWFGESPSEEAFEAIRNDLPKADIMLEVGTSGVVSYGLTQASARLGIPTVRINPEPRQESGVIEIAEPAEVALPALIGLL